MNMFGLCAIFCFMIIYAVNVCDAKCDEYFVVFKEMTRGGKVTLAPLKEREIQWDKVTYPCNNTNENSEKKKCLVEFDCLGKQGYCQIHTEKRNYQTHIFIDNKKERITSTSEALVVPKPIITVEEKPHHTIDEEFNTTTNDVNLIYVNDNGRQNSSGKISNCSLYCDYAETVCVDEGRPETYSLSDVIKATNNIHSAEFSGVLKLSINRDETSPVQPIFTGYFPESSNDSYKNYDNDLKYFKTVALTCLNLKYDNCKQNVKKKSSKQINVYIKTNCVKSNTITKYPNCTKNSIISENVLSLKCEDTIFAKHNPQIPQTPPTPPPKQELVTWNCQITKLNKLSNEQHSENKIHFMNCSSATKAKTISNNTNKYEDVNVTPISDHSSISVSNILTTNGIEMNKTEFSTGKEALQNNPKNIITIFIKEKANNCSNNSFLNINEGKIIDMGINNNKEKILQNNNVKLILSNCINVVPLTINEMQRNPKVELSIILKNESLNNSNIKQFNGTAKDGSVKQRILLRCDYPKLDLTSNTTSNTTLLQCESIDLDLFNITGIEVTPLSQTTNNKTAIRYQNKTKHEVSTWNCETYYLNKTFSSKKQHSEKSHLYFKNCANDVSIKNSKNKSWDFGKNKIINSITPTIGSINNTNDIIKRNNTEMPGGKHELNVNNFSQKTSENMIKIVVTQEANNCSDSSSLNIDEGKIIDLGANINENKFILNNVVELKLSSCIDIDSSITNETQPNPKVDLTIILKNESLNDLNIKQFNGTVKEGSVKQRILLQCDYPKLDLTSNTTLLQCESIDLDLFNITGIKVTPLSQTTNNKTAIRYENKTKHVVSTRNCETYYLNKTFSSKKQHSKKSNLYFKNCANDVSINNSKNKSWDFVKNKTINNITPTIGSINNTNDIIKRNNTEMPGGKQELNANNFSQKKTENMIKIVVTQEANNCSNNSSLNIDEGKIIDLGANINENKFILNNVVELKLSSCIDIDSSITNETQPNLKVDLTIILKNESLNDLNIKQFNGTAKEGSVKQRILLRCDSNNTELQCESIDLDLHSITGIEMSTNGDLTSNASNTKKEKKENLKLVEENHNQTKVYSDKNKNNTFSTNKGVEKNESTVNNKSNEINIKVIDNKGVQKNIPEGNKNNSKVVENKEAQKKISEIKENSKTLNFNRKKDIPNGAGQNSLALGNPETEKILMIALLTIASVSILILLALKVWPEKKEYNPAPTREPRDDEETAF